MLIELINYLTTDELFLTTGSFLFFKKKKKSLIKSELRNTALKGNQLFLLYTE